MYGHTFAQALCKLNGDELRLVYVLCCDTAVQELLVSKIRDWIKREPERFASQLQAKALAYREWSDDELRLGILLELGKRSRLHGAPLKTSAELEEFSGEIVERIELDAAEEDRAYFAYREAHPETNALEALIDYQMELLVQGLGRLLDHASQPEWDEYVRRIEPLLPEESVQLWETVRTDGEMPDPKSSADRSDEQELFGEEDIPAGIAESPGAVEALRSADEASSSSDYTAAGEEPTVEAAAEAEAAAQPARPKGVKLLRAALDQREGYAYYETFMSLLASAEGLFGIGQMPELHGRRIKFLAVSSSPAFLHMLPGGTASAPRTLYRSLNPQRRRLPLLLVQLFLPELVSEDELEADYEPMLALWRSRSEQYAALKSEIAEEDLRIEYYKRESASCTEQLEAFKTERAGSEKRISEIRDALVNKLRVSSMQLPHISESFDGLLAEYADNRRRIEDAETSRREREEGFTGLFKYTLNFATLSVALADLRRKQDRLLERMADEALHNEGEWGQGERYVVAAERDRIHFVDTEIARLEKLQTEYREQLRHSEQVRKTLEQEKKKLEKQVYGLIDL